MFCVPIPVGENFFSYSHVNINEKKIGLSFTKFLSQLRCPCDMWRFSNH